MNNSGKTVVQVDEFVRKVKKETAQWYNDNVELDNDRKLTPDDIIVVWQAKVLQNHKCLVISNLFDSRYFEFTYNGDEEELYMDIYTKDYHKRILW